MRLEIGLFKYGLGDRSVYGTSRCTTTPGGTRLEINDAWDLFGGRETTKNPSDFLQTSAHIPDVVLFPDFETCKIYTDGVVITVAKAGHVDRYLVFTGDVFKEYYRRNMGFATIRSAMECGSTGGNEAQGLGIHGLLPENISPLDEREYSLLTHSIFLTTQMDWKAMSE